MFKSRNLWWILAVLCVLSVTIVLYINYDNQNNQAVETTVPESKITDTKGRRNPVIPMETSSETEEELQDESESPSEEGINSGQDESPDVSLTTEDLYNVDLLQADGISPLNPTQYNSVANVIDSTLSEFDVNSSEISLAYYNFNNSEHYYINENNMITAASVTKVPLSALFLDLIAEDEYELDSQLPYTDAMFEVGNGKITNQPTQSTYPIQDLITEAIIRSDNTAMNVLKSAYDDHYGNFREDTLKFAGLENDENIPDSFASSNVISAYIMEQVFIKIAENDTYDELIALMTQSTPNQLFTKYINSEMMANKYGRYDQAVNDAGIYYENGQPQYALIVLTDNVNNADNFLEIVNLRVNEWHQSHKTTT